MPPDAEAGNSAQKGALTSEEWSGPWGVIEPVPQSVETLCVEIDDEMGNPCLHYYPYRTIGQWSWKMEQPELLEIHVGGSQIIISGTGLRRLAEALNRGQLRLIHFSGNPKAEGNTAVRAIRFKD